MKRRVLSRFLLLVCGLALLLDFPFLSHAAELTLKVTDKEPPTEVDASIRTILQPKAIQLLDGEKPVFEFWFRNEIPVKSKPGSSEQGLQAIAETTLLGVVAVRVAQKDYKDKELAAGVYTSRFSFQPSDGDHLGTAEYPYFMVLIPAKLDTKLDGITTYKAMTKASAKETATGHPLIISLRPATSEATDLPKLNEPAPDHKSMRLKVPVKVADKDEKASLVFELVYKGKGKI